VSLSAVSTPNKRGLLCELCDLCVVRCLFDVEEFDVEHERGVRRDDPAGSP